jgi:hypothetical protein
MRKVKTEISSQSQGSEAWTILDVQRATAVNQALLVSLMALMADHDWQARLACKFCRVCYYVDPPTIKERDDQEPKFCKLCEDDIQILGAKIFCAGCASRYALCSRCGGDIELMPRRTFTVPYHEFKHPEKLETGHEDILI